MGYGQLIKASLPKATWRSLILLLLGRRRRFRIDADDGQSMRPTLKPNDVLIVRPIRQGDPLPEKGRIVLVRHPLLAEKLMIKRVHQIGKEGLDLRGDNPLESTDSRQFGLVNCHYLRGTVEGLI